MINNLELIKPILKFSSEDTFYFLQILQRKKEHPELGRNSNVVKNYYINSLEYLERKMPEIISLCEFFNARAMLRLTPRSYRKTAFDNLQKVAKMCSDGDFKAVGKSYVSSSGSTTEGTLKLWIIDIDDKETDLDKMRMDLELLEPFGHDKVVAAIPSKAGYHLITKPFNKSAFSKIYPSIEIHKDNPTNLIII